jgi:N-acetylmuramoyl-L-alanine amidase
MAQAQVVIDPGHGGTEERCRSSPNNAEGPTGLLEKTVTLQVGLETRDALVAAGISVLLTRDTDVNLGLAKRAHVARDTSADAFVSIHLNDDENPAVQGTETWVHTNASAASNSLAQFVQDAVQAVTGYRDRGVKSMNLGVLDPAEHLEKTAGCLVEISFMSDPTDETRLKDSAYRAKLGAGIATAIRQYLIASGKLAAPGVAIAGVGHAPPVLEDATDLA